MRRTTILAYALLGVLAVPAVLAQDEPRQLVELPPMMQEHMLANMRDHLSALSEIIGALGRQDYEQAARTAEQRLGMSSLETHGASHMAQYMPEEMQAIGTRMHRAASRFALDVENRAVEGNLAPALESLSDVMGQCAACHAGYRIH